MNLKELIAAVSGSTGIGEASVKKVVTATIATINKQFEHDEPMKLHGLGTFVRRPGKEAGKSRVVFRPWPTEDEKQARKEKKKEKRAKKAEAVE